MKRTNRTEEEERRKETRAECEKFNTPLQACSGWGRDTHLIVVSDPGRDECDTEKLQK